MRKNRKNMALMISSWEYRGQRIHFYSVGPIATWSC